MIINCPNCNKRFKINTSLIPVEGRDLKCGLCDHVWFYKIEDKNLEPLSLKEDIINNEDKPEIVDKKIERTNEVKKSSSHSKIDTKDKKDLDKIADKQITSKNKTKNTMEYYINDNAIRRSPSFRISTAKPPSYIDLAERLSKQVPGP